jgi:hypothetical protein
LNADDDPDNAFNDKIEKWAVKNPDYIHEVYKKRPRKGRA